MNRSFLSLLAGALSLTVFLFLLVPAVLGDEEPAPPKLAPAKSRAELKQEGFRRLFNGKDLTNWKADAKAQEHWAVVDGVIRYNGKNQDLWTAKPYQDFILMIDWRVTKPGDDSGIYLRGNSKSQVNIWNHPLGSGEVYGYRTDDKLPQEVRKAATPCKKADKPIGQWNRFIITLKGDRLTVVLNGEEVISNAELPGIPKSGPIALQHHGTRVDFCNIFIKELKE
jgi:hypothetical protein